MPLLESRKHWRNADGSMNQRGFVRSRCGIFRRALLPGDAFELKLLDAVANLIAIQTKKSRGFGLVPPGSLERLNDERSFQLLEIEPSGRQFDGLAEPNGHCSARGEVARIEDRPV